MLNFNQVIFLGQLGGDVKIKKFDTKAGGKYRTLRFNACANHTTYTASGDKRETAQWFHVVQNFNADAKGKYPPMYDYLSDNLNKGVTVHVTGRIQTREFKDTENVLQTITEVITNGKGSISVQAPSGSSSGQVVERDNNSSSGGIEISRNTTETSKVEATVEDDEPF
jgi:single-stranded DNA-binding protein